MEKLKKQEAFSRAVETFGPWNTWGRADHIAYGLIRGVSYVVMERYANDNPSHYSITSRLVRLGAWPKPQPEETPRSWWKRLFGKKDESPPSRPRVSHEDIQDHVPEVEALVVWVRKPVRGPRIRSSKRALEPELATG